MAISKVILNSDVQMDITDTTATQGQVASTAYYYGADGIKKQGSYVVPSAVTQATPTISVNSSTGLITASATQSAGVVSAGTKSATEQLSTENGKTVTPTTSEQTAVAANKYTLGAIKVAAMPAGSAATPATSITANPSISVSSGGLITATASATKSVTPTVSAGYVSSGTAGTITVSGSNTSQLTTQAAQTIYPSTSDQTIASGKYLTGVQTFAGVLLTNLSAGNIKKDVVVKVGDSADDDRITSVTGTYEGGSGGAGLVYETGVWTPATDTTDEWIGFSGSHAEAPFFFIIFDNVGTYDDTLYSNVYIGYVNFHQLTGAGLYVDSSSIRYGLVSITYRNKTATSFTTSNTNLTHPYTDLLQTSGSYSRYWATETGIRATNATNIYWRSTRSYKWVAVWRPTT